MKAADFAYAKPETLAQALDLLARPGAMALAGGQSLIPGLNMRLSAPEVLVDIGGLPGMAAIEVAGGRVKIGALATHAQLQRAPEVAAHVPLLAQAVPHVAHAAIRNRGTLGGSLANADPAAEYPACAVALEATIHVAGRAGERSIPAGAFFKDLFETALAPGELITAVSLPAKQAGDRDVFLELARRSGDYAMVGLAVHNRRFVFFGVGNTPVAFDLGPDLAAAKAAVKAKLHPPADLYNSPATKLHLAGVLLERAWNA